MVGPKEKAVGKSCSRPRLGQDAEKLDTDRAGAVGLYRACPVEGIEDALLLFFLVTGIDVKH